MKNLVAVKVQSDNFEGLMTVEAYSEFRLQMSTGDFHTHKHSIVSVDQETLDTEVMTLEQILNEGEV